MIKILIIDDDEEYCRELTQIVKAQDFEVNVAMDGILGGSLALKENYQLVILDLKLPGLNGYEILKSIKRNKNPVKVLVLSGRPLGENMLERDDLSKEQEDKVLQMADAVMSKPFKVDDFLNKIKEITGK